MSPSRSICLHFYAVFGKKIAENRLVQPLLGLALLHTSEKFPGWLGMAHGICHKRQYFTIFSYFKVNLKYQF